MNHGTRMVLGNVGIFALLFAVATGIEGYRYVSKHRFMASYGVWNMKPYAISVKNSPRLGQQTAPVTIVEFGDFKCSTCMAWDKRVFPQLKKQLIDTGQVNFYFEPYLVIPQSTDAALAGLSVYRQNPAAFWTYYRAIYQHQGPELQNWATPTFLSSFVKSFVPGVSAQTVLKDITQQAELPEIVAAHKEGRLVGVSETPTVFIDGYVLQDPFNFKSIKKLVAREIKVKG